MHLVTETMRRAYADRAAYLGDADFVAVPVKHLISSEYAAKLREQILTSKPEAPVQAGLAMTWRESSQTTHFSVVDAEGNAVANTYTLNGGYGSGVTVEGAGFLLNDEMDDFAAKPGQPNMFGLVQGEANSIQPRKRPLSSMTPTIVLRKDGSLWFAVGARGGPRIISAVIQTVINVIDHDMDIQQAIDAPRIHHQWLPDEILFEPFGLSPDTLKVLQNYGQRFAEKPGYVASATGIMIGKDGVRLGAIDARSDGEAVGY